MKKLFILGIALFFCLSFVGCSWVTSPPVIPDNGGMNEYDSQFISLLNELDTPSKLMYENTGAGFTNSHFMFLL